MVFNSNMYDPDELNRGNLTNTLRVKFSSTPKKDPPNALERKKNMEAYAHSLQ